MSMYEHKRLQPQRYVAVIKFSKVRRHRMTQFADNVVAGCASQPLCYNGAALYMTGIDGKP